MRKIVAMVVVISFIISSCTMETLRFEELEEKGNFVFIEGATPSASSTPAPVLILETSYYDYDNGYKLKRTEKIEKVKNTVIKLSDMVDEGKQFGYEVGSVNYCNETKCFHLMEEGIKINGTSLKFKVFCLNEFKDE
jgi:hypothetical protein